MEEEPNKEEPGKEPEPEKASESGNEPFERPEGDTAGRESTAQENTNQEGTGQESTGREQQYQVPPHEREAPYSGTYRHKLHKSRTNRILFGVCGGLGEYLNIDPVIIRLIFILSFLLGGWGFLIYIIAAIVMPGSPRVEAAPEKEERISSENGKIIFGSALILLGLYAFLRTTGFLRFFSFFGITHEFIIPLILIVLGIILITRHREFLYRESPHPGKKLYRSSTNRMIAGVCSGLGNYLNIDPTLIRIIWVILTFGSFGIGILIYILFALLVPLDNEVNLEK